MCWAGEVCALHSAALTLDWPAIVALCGREPASLLVARTLAEYVVPAHDWTVVPRRDLVERTGYMQKQVRVALRRLEAAGLVESEGATGRTARYRFAARALASRWNESVDPPHAPGPALVAPSFPAAHGTVVRPTPTVATTQTERGEAQGVELEIGGVTVRMAPGTSLDVGAGARAQVAVGADGRLSLKIVQD